jgi:peptidyl-prolyl cis-trans isomerase B (cyclophilin B)
VAASKSQDRADRAARQRLRSYTARQTVHRTQVQRRRRDNIIAGIALLAVIVLATVAQVLYFTAGPGIPAATPTASPSPTASSSAAPQANSGDVPSSSIAEGRTWTGDLTINGIPLAISLDGALAPQGVSSFISLSKSGFYNGLTCHRLTTGGFYVLQCGDPKGDGSGGPDYSYGPIENAPADGVYPAGTIAMARQSGNAYSNGSQFFIVYRDTTIPADAAGGYTVLGTITSGLDQLNTAVTAVGVAGGSTDGAPAVPTTIDSITVQ